jgi:hypothetical protein
MMRDDTSPLVTGGKEWWIQVSWQFGSMIFIFCHELGNMVIGLLQEGMEQSRKMKYI